jgi:hypothetical protein
MDPFLKAAAAVIIAVVVSVTSRKIVDRRGIPVGRRTIRIIGCAQVVRSITV